MSAASSIRSLCLSIVDRMPIRLALAIDFHVGPGRSHSAQGPLNGQVRRREIVEDLLLRQQFVRLVESGTYLGTSTGYFAERIPRVHTVEAAARNCAAARANLARYDNIEMTLGDSRSFLRRIAADPLMTTGPTFFYLDAHWYRDLPLAEELRIVAGGWEDAVVMIDDFRVPGDPGYGFDDYGPELRLTESILPVDALGRWDVFYPTAPASTETGSRRGSAFVVSPSLADVVGDSTLLRPSETFRHRAADHRLAP
jgi:hypothetical protein